MLSRLAMFFYYLNEIKQNVNTANLYAYITSDKRDFARLAFLKLHTLNNKNIA